MLFLKKKLIFFLFSFGFVEMGSKGEYVINIFLKTIPNSYSSFGFVEMGSEKEAEEAAKALNGTKLLGRQVWQSWSLQ